MQQFLTL